MPAHHSLCPLGARHVRIARFPQQDELQFPNEGLHIINLARYEKTGRQILLGSQLNRQELSCGSSFCFFRSAELKVGRGEYREEKEELLRRALHACIARYVTHEGREWSESTVMRGFRLFSEEFHRALRGNVQRINGRPLFSYIPTGCGIAHAIGPYSERKAANAPRSDHIVAAESERVQRRQRLLCALPVTPSPRSPSAPVEPQALHRRCNGVAAREQGL